MNDTKIHAVLTALMPTLDPQQPARWRKVTLTELCEVEELLDCLESEGHDRRLIVVDEETFVIRWR